MKVIEQIKDLEKINYAVVTIGMFDGVHKAHQTILRTIVAQAKKNNGKSVLITFWPHPKFILDKDTNKIKLLTTFKEKTQWISELGVDYFLKLSFTPEFSKLSAEQFIKKILIDSVGTKQLFIGYDHHFGNNREGDIHFLQNNAHKYPFIVNEISKQEIDDVGISSTKIRELLSSGKISKANTLLGWNYSLGGWVVEGNKQGRSIDFPTANITIDEDFKLLPADGVYAVRVNIEGKKYDGMLNIGFKPTILGTNRTIETHIFNFSQEIYGKYIRIELVKKLRKEIKFQSLEELKNQLIKDREESLKLLNNFSIMS